MWKYFQILKKLFSCFLLTLLSPPPRPLFHSLPPPSVISGSLITNPTGVLFIRQAGGERPTSWADPATLSSSGIWHWNFNRRAAQAGRQVSPGDAACMPICADQVAWTQRACCAAGLTVCNEPEGWGGADEERMMASGKAVVKGSRGTTLRHRAAIQVRAEEGDGRLWWQVPAGKLKTY